jgi:hypothetical protein
MSAELTAATALRSRFLMASDRVAELLGEELKTR